jgi:hypothetical protein
VRSGDDAGFADFAGALPDTNESTRKPSDFIWQGKGAPMAIMAFGIAQVWKAASAPRENPRRS